MQRAHEISRHSERNIREKCIFVYHRQEMCGPVKCGDFYTFSAPRLGRHKTVTTPEITDQIHELMFEDRKISFKWIGEQVSISLDRVKFIIHEYLYMRNLREMSTEMLESGIKRELCQSSEQIWKIFVAIQMIFSLARLVTVYETWLYHYDLETKQNSIHWRHRFSLRHKKIRVKKSDGKFLA